MSLHDLASITFWKLCGLLPINPKKVLFSSYNGRGYSDSPKAIAEVLLSCGQDLDLCWLVKDEKEATSLPDGIRPVFMHSKKRVLEVSTAKVWVDNCRKYERFKRKGQYYLQTWHGFALKRIERDAADALDEIYLSNAKRDAAQTDLMVSGSGFMTKCYQTAFWYDGPVQAWGTPRNDIFFHPDPSISEHVRAFFGLPSDCRLMLYAPTFRTDHSTACYALDAKAALAACHRRFGGNWAALIRLHPNVAHQSATLFPYDGQTILDATSYPDMQELLVAADLLITDYSSSMFDYALQEKPCIQFALDVEQYRNDRNFYFSLDALPFPLAKSNEELEQILEAYDPAQQHICWTRFGRENGFCEDGLASHRCARWILEQLQR